MMMTSSITAAVPFLFDPQTSGGLLGVFALKDTEKAVNALVNTGHRAAVIGQLDKQIAGIKLVSGK